MAQFQDSYDSQGTYQGTTVTYLHADHLGTPRLGTNGSQQVTWRYESDAFGIATLSGTAVVGLRFPGQQSLGIAGLNYNYYRDYVPDRGRYLESDPIGIDGGLNTYGYADQKPTRLIDPDGQSAIAIVRAVGAATCFVYDAYRVYQLTNELEALQEEVDGIDREIERLECTVPVSRAEEDNRRIALVQLEQAKVRQTNERLSRQSEGAATAVGIAVVCAAIGARTGPAPRP